MSRRRAASIGGGLLVVALVAIAISRLVGGREQPAPARGIAPPTPAEARLRRMVQREPRRAAGWILLVRYLIDGGRSLDALDAARDASAACPGEPTIQGTQARAMMAAGLLPEAAALLRPLAAAPEDRILLADSLVRQGQWEAGVRELRSLPPLEPGDAQQAARVAFAALAPGEAARLLRASPPPHNSAIQELLGLAQLRAGDYGAAALQLQAGLGSGSGSAATRFHLGAAGRLAGGQDRLSQAQADLSLAAEERADDPAVQYELARALLEQGEWPAARSLLERAAGAAPDWPEVWRDLALAYRRTDDPRQGRLASARHLQRTGRAEAAVTLLAPAAAREPDDLELPLALASAHFQAGQTQRALALLRSLRQRAPDHPRVLRDLFQAEFTSENYRQALDALDAHLRLEPGNPALLATRPDVLRYLLRHDEAETLLRQLRGRDPGNPARHLWLGRALTLWSTSPDRLRDAEACFRTALRRQPGDGEAHQELGALLHHAGRHSEARPHLRRAVELSPGTPEPLRLLALCYGALGEQGRSAEAFTLYRRARVRQEEAQELERLVSGGRATPAARLRRYRFFLLGGDSPAAVRELERHGPEPTLDAATRRELAALYGHLNRFQRQAEVLGRRTGGVR